jgi:hypothetical protein
VETSSNEKITELQSQLNTAKEVHAGDIHDLCAQYAAHSSSQTPTLDSDQRYKALQQEFNTLRKKFVANSDALEITDNESRRQNESGQIFTSSFKKSTASYRTL